MTAPRGLFVLLGELGVVSPYLVLQRGARYWRIEDLIKQARKDLARGNDAVRSALAEPAYVSHRDTIGKMSIRSSQSGTILFSEVGALELAPPIPEDA